MDTTTGVGARVAHLRKLRGLTQTALGARSSYSTDYVKKVEQGRVPPSAAFVGAVARALDVDPSYLYGVEDRVLAEESGAVQLADLRAAVDAWDDPRPDGRLLGLATVNRRLEGVSKQVTATRYAEAAEQLAPLLHHLYVLADRAGSDGEGARSALHDAYRLAATIAGRFRQADIAAVASERHITLAPGTGDPLRVAISAFHRSSRYLTLGDYAGGLRVLERVEGLLAGPSSVAAQVHLRSAVLLARSGHLDRADEHLTEARTMRQENQSQYLGIDASTLNIDVHWCALPVEALDGTEAVRRGAEVHLPTQGQPERVGHHHIDQARAWFLHGDRKRCLEELNTARRIAPFTTRHHPAVRETVIALAAGDRRRNDSVAGFATWVGVAG